MAWMNEYPNRVLITETTIRMAVSFLLFRQQNASEYRPAKIIVTTASLNLFIEHPFC
ncbi:MAG: hypothetical protein WC027_01475 [Candidatus Paceibacterota bacterium]